MLSMKYPIGIQDFKTVRTKDYFYADKSALLYKLVKSGQFYFLSPYFTSIRPTQTSSFVANFVKDMEQGKVDSFMQRLEALFADSDYQVMGDAELYFQNAVWIIFKMMGFYTEVERHTTDGRIDILIKTQEYVYILECPTRF